MNECVVQAIEFYTTPAGMVPFREWHLGLWDDKVRSKISMRIDRLAIGNFCDFRSLGEGLFELRIHEGRGYRIYFGRRGHQIVVILSGGDKNRQLKDIHTAHQYWREYKERVK